MNGAQSSTGTTEAETNLKIALKVQNLLEQSGATVILTRSDENAIYDLDKNTLREKKISDIHNRVKIGNESQADIFVSIHLNKIPQEQYWGWQCFYRQNDEKSTKLAKCLQQNLNEAIDRENKRVAMKIDNVYIIKHVEIPISIVECGFLSNKTSKVIFLLFFVTFLKPVYMAFLDFVHQLFDMDRYNIVFPLDKQNIIHNMVLMHLLVRTS